MIRPRACWGAACDLLGVSVVYPAGGTVTISKKSPLIRILSKRADCIDCGDFVNGRGKGPLVKGGCPRERTGGFRRAAREDGAARMRPGIPPASQARPPVPPLALRATSPGTGESVFDKEGFSAPTLNFTSNFTLAKSGKVCYNLIAYRFSGKYSRTPNQKRRVPPHVRTPVGNPCGFLW